MEERHLGRSGLKVSVVGLGCNNFGMRIGLEDSRKVIHRAIDAGITLFDTADIYGDRGGSEDIMGQILGDRRKEIVLATKFGKPMSDDGRKVGGSRRYIMEAVEASLKRLRTDWIDLYQMHDPDPDTPIEETLSALDDLVRQGKVRYIGCSNYAAWQMAAAQHVAREINATPFISCQDEYSLVVRKNEAELIPAAKAYGMGLLPFFPLASGLLTGKYRKGEKPPEGTRLAAGGRTGRFLSESNLDKAEALRAFAEARGHTLLELAFSWLAGQAPVTSVIAGATRPEQVDSNVAAVGWKLSDEDRAEIDRITLS